MPFLELKEVSFEYPNGFKAVDNVSLSFELGEKAAIVGQNGAGKTTTVKLMNGLLKPDQGDVTVGGLNTKDYTTAQISRRVGYVFQNPDDQIFHSNIINEIKFGPKVLGFTEEEAEKWVNLAIELTGLSDYLEENPYNVPLSYRKFITIASVIAMDTDVLIFDEPTAGQDLYGVERLTHIINRLQALGKTVIIITHDMEFVIRHFTRVIVMANKKVLADGNCRDIFWDLNLLDKSMLKQPCISRVAYEIGLKDAKPLFEDEVVSLLVEESTK
ncbi:energy-coupling factor ABC transporter ATP-binding protein [Scopulibacillus cellulosilyticus]|uniref:Energy-coupling factor ABC transporter ATP-binding protein n=1 Tax=Scopulibacillus cellulosilyticus TaxID=2665665 RepID=A0ABW2Q476_9BACL